MPTKAPNSRRRSKPARPAAPAPAAAPEADAAAQPTPSATFYDVGLTAAERRDLEALLGQPNATDLLNEIKMLRAYTRRVFQLGREVDNLPEAVSTLRALAMAAAQTAALLRQQSELSGQQHQELLQALSQMIEEVQQELTRRESNGAP